MNKLVTVSGFVIRILPDEPIISMGKSSLCLYLPLAFYQCTTCYSEQKLEWKEGLDAPDCTNHECRQKYSMKFLCNRSGFAKMQRFQIQESQEETENGRIPQTIRLQSLLTPALELNSGDSVTFTGIFRTILVPIKTGKIKLSNKLDYRQYCDLVIDVVGARPVSVPVGDDEEDSCITSTQVDLNGHDGDNQLYELLARSIAPSIFGLDDVKKGLLLQLFGGIFYTISLFIQYSS